MPEAGRDDTGEPGVEPGPEDVEHHPRRIAAPVGTAHGPGYADVEEPEEEEGRERCGPGKPALPPPEPEAGGRDRAAI